MTLQQTATIILALLATVAAGAGIVCYVAWRERRRAENAQALRDMQQPTGGGGPRPTLPK